MIARKYFEYWRKHKNFYFLSLGSLQKWPLEAKWLKIFKKFQNQVRVNYFLGKVSEFRQHRGKTKEMAIKKLTWGAIMAPPPRLE